MLEHEPIVVLLSFAVFYYLLSRLLPSKPRGLHYGAILFWMSLGIYWGIYLGVMTSVAPWFSFLNGLVLSLAIFDHRLRIWLDPLRQGLLVIMCIMALYLDYFADLHRFDLMLLTLFSWSLLPLSILVLDGDDDDAGIEEGLWKSISNLFAGFLALSFGLLLLANSQSELGGSIYFAGWGWLGTLFFFLGWIWLAGVWPLQTWLVDELESQALANLLFRLLIQGFVFIWLARLWLSTFPDIHVLPSALLFVAILGLIWTKLLALMQTSMRRSIAYQFQAVFSGSALWLALLSQRLVNWDWWLLAFSALLAFAVLAIISFHSLSRLTDRLGMAPIHSDLFRTQHLQRPSFHSLMVSLVLDIVPVLMMLAALPVLYSSGSWQALFGVILAGVVALYATYQCSWRILIAK